MTTAIGTALFYDRSASAMNRLTQQSATLNTQISTGKRLQAPSDDSVAYQRLQGLARGTADDGAYAGNITTAQSLLQQGDMVLSSITSQLQRAQELALQAKNGTLSAANRATVATELDGIVQTLTALANTMDTRGQPLFGGSDGQPAVTVAADGSHVLNASAPASIPVGDGQSVQPSENAARVLGTANGGNVIDRIAQLSAALKAGGDGGTAADELSAAHDQVANVQGSLGARASRLELEQSRLKDVAADRESTRSALEDTDVTQAITDLQKTMTVLQATQASFAKLSALSLFDYLR